MNNAKLILIILSILLCATTVALPEDSNLKDIRDKILSAQDSEVLDAIDDTDKLHLQQGDLIQLYVEILDYYVGEGPGEILGRR